jgi:hypothetical protein
LAAIWLASTARGALVIEFDYTYDTGGFFADAGRRNCLEAAAAVYESAVRDDLFAVSSYDDNHWTNYFTNPQNGALQAVGDASIASNTFRLYVGARDLGASTLGRGGPGGFTATGTADFVYGVWTRGQWGVTNDTDFARWGGAVAFNSTKSWYFDDDPSTVEAFPGQSDFFSTALHEISHTLGFSSSDSFGQWISGANFTGPSSMALYGGPIPMSSQTNHWTNGTMSAYKGSPQEAAMDPDLTEGTRKYITDLDWAALTDTGWVVIPEPAAAGLLFAGGLAAFLGRRRRRR